VAAVVDGTTEGATVATEDVVVVTTASVAIAAVTGTVDV
jgi:hypothetical protein